MQIINTDLSSVQSGEIIIVPMSDLHIGDPLSDWRLIQQRVEYIHTHDNVYCVLDGDLIDNATRTSIGDIYGQRLNPMESVKTISTLLTPIRDKILAACPGNHEHRTYRSDGIDITEMICSNLGIVDRYSPTTALVTIKTAKNTYTLYITHGSGGGRKAGGKVNRLLDLAQIVDADIYLMGHTHTPTATRQAIMERRGNRLIQADRLFVITAAALTYGGYADAQGYAPASLINPTIHLCTNGDKFAWAVI